MFRQELYRIASNYVRLFAGLVIGLYVIRLLLGIGSEVFGIYTLVTIGFGVSIMLVELLRMGLVPLLGTHVQAGHPVDRKSFRVAYAGSFIIALGAAVLGAVAMLLLGLFLLPSTISPELERAAWIFLVLRIAMMGMVVSLTPLMNVLLVTRRLPLFNFFLFLERLSELLALLVPLALFSHLSDVPSDRLVQFGVCSLAFMVLIYSSLALVVKKLDPDFCPRLGQARGEAIRDALRLTMWGSLVTVSMNLYVRFDVLLVAYVFGPTGAAILGVAIRLMGYVRQVTIGLVNGLDSVFSNLTGLSRRKRALESETAATRARLIDISTGLQASFIFQANAIMLLLRDDLVMLWIGDIVTDVETALPAISSLSMLMIAGISIRSLNLGWMSAMTGMGEARRFTVFLLPAAIANPVILIGWYLLRPDNFSLTSIGWVFVLMQVLTHAVVLPQVAARVLAISLRRLLKPMAMPLVIAVTSTLIAFILKSFLATSDLLMRDGVVLFVLLAGLVVALVFVLRNARRILAV